MAFFVMIFGIYNYLSVINHYNDFERMRFHFIFVLFLVQRTDSYAFENALFRLGDVDKDPNQPNQYIVPLIVNKEVDREAIPDSTKYLYLGIKVFQSSFIFFIS